MRAYLDRRLLPRMLRNTSRKATLLSEKTLSGACAGDNAMAKRMAYSSMALTSFSATRKATALATGSSQYTPMPPTAERRGTDASV